MSAVRLVVAAGLDADDAVRALTLAPAEIFGVEDRLGSVEVGKIGNHVVTTGDLLAPDTRVRMVFVDGALVQQPAETLADASEDGEDSEGQDEGEGRDRAGANQPPEWTGVTPMTPTGPYLESDVWYIHGATIMTGTGETIENGQIVVRDGKIAEVGTDLDRPRRGAGDRRVRSVDHAGHHRRPFPHCRGRHQRGQRQRLGHGRNRRRVGPRGCGDLPRCGRRRDHHQSAPRQRESHRREERGAQDALGTGCGRAARGGRPRRDQVRAGRESVPDPDSGPLPELAHGRHGRDPTGVPGCPAVQSGLGGVPGGGRFGRDSATPRPQAGRARGDPRRGADGARPLVPGGRDPPARSPGGGVRLPDQHVPARAGGLPRGGRARRPRRRSLDLLGLVGLQGRGLRGHPPQRRADDGARGDRIDQLGFG